MVILSEYQVGVDIKKILNSLQIVTLVFIDSLLKHDANGAQVQ
jgi:hypothetical protein